MESQKSSLGRVETNVKDPRSSLFSPRSLRQFGIYVAGAGFFAVSMAITRRSIMRKYYKDMPKFFSPSHQPNIEVNGALDGLEALNLATINVLSVAVMTAGGMLWAFDISTMDEMRKRFQMNTTQDHMMKDELSDKMIEDWLTSILERREFKALKNITSIANKQQQDKNEGEKNVKNA